MDAFIGDLRARYGIGAIFVQQAAASATFIKVVGVGIPGRKGITTDVLLSVSPSFRSDGARPTVHYRPGTAQPNGRPGRNVTPTLVNGEPWLAASWQFDWDPTMPAWVLVEGALRRFTVNED